MDIYKPFYFVLDSCSLIWTIAGMLHSLLFLIFSNNREGATSSNASKNKSSTGFLGLIRIEISGFASTTICIYYISMNFFAIPLLILVFISSASFVLRDLFFARNFRSKAPAETLYKL